jgi:hypothetical protein
MKKKDMRPHNSCEHEEEKNKDTRTNNLKKKERDKKFAKHQACGQTFAASATMSGSSIAVTSFSAGREFATKTTCINKMVGSAQIIEKSSFTSITERQTHLSSMTEEFPC